MGRASASNGALRKSWSGPESHCLLEEPHVGQKWPGSRIIVCVVTDREQPWESICRSEGTAAGGCWLMTLLAAGSLEGKYE